MFAPPPDSPLYGVWMKLDRARFHLELLDQAISQFATRIESGDAYQVSIEYEPEARQHIFRLRVLEEPPSIPWGIIAGDAIHNLRSALDHFVEQMTIRHSGGPMTQTAFPIFDDAGKFRDNGRRMIRGCSPAVRKAIADMQPYHRSDPTTDPLWKLHDLWNMDKHRVVAIVGIVASKRTFKKLPVIGKIDMSTDPGPVPFISGAEVGPRMLLVEPLDPEASVKLNLPLNIIFEHSREAVFPVLERAHNAAMNAIVLLNSL